MLILYYIFGMRCLVKTFTHLPLFLTTLESLTSSSGNEICSVKSCIPLDHEVIFFI